MKDLFGERVQGYNIPVLNEREVRASAGILFLLMYTALMMIIFSQNFILIKYMITFFFADFIIRVIIHPRYSPTLILGRLIVNRQVPEYVGAAQKKFAWWIGLTLATTMFVLMVVMNTYSIITGLICLVCLIFLFFESVFGICLGCIFYKIFYKEKAQYCPGEVCALKERQEIQKTSKIQLGIVLAFTLFIFITAYFFNDNFKIMPTELWGTQTSQVASGK